MRACDVFWCHRSLKVRNSEAPRSTGISPTPPEHSKVLLAQVCVALVFQAGRPEFPAPTLREGRLLVRGRSSKAILYELQSTSLLFGTAMTVE